MRRLRSWAGRLHVGQLIMFLLPSLAFAYVGGIMAVELLPSTRAARRALANRDYCCDDRLALNGRQYRFADSPEGRARRDTLESTGGRINPFIDLVPGSQSEVFRTYGIEIERRDTRDTLEQTGSLSRLLLGYVCLIVFLTFSFLLFAVPWWWFGARAQGRPTS